MKSFLTPICLLLCAAGHIAFAEPVVPETDEAKFVRLTRQLEGHPLADANKSIRSWLIEWATKSKDIKVTVCDVLGPIPAQEVPHASELLAQSIFGNAAFQIAHPNRRKDIVATQLAGVRSATAAYSAIIAKDSNARIAYFDTLVTKERDGSLDAFMAPIIAKGCTQ